MNSNNPKDLADKIRVICLLLSLIFLTLRAEIIMAAQGPSLLSLKRQDAQFRAKVVGKEQVEIEKTLISARNGVFVLFTPTHGTPQMISDKSDIPEGLIPKERMESYSISVKPRVETTHQMPAANVRCIFIRYQANRSHAEDGSKIVDEIYYKQLTAKYPNLIFEKIISPEIYNHFVKEGIPAAFYYYTVDQNPHYSAVFGKQINSKVGNKLSDPGTYSERKQDLEIVNEMLTSIGLQPVEQLINADMRHVELGSLADENGQRISARL